MFEYQCHGSLLGRFAGIYGSEAHIETLPLIFQVGNGIQIASHDGDIGVLKGIGPRLSTKTINWHPRSTWSRLTWNIGGLSLETIVCAVWTVQVGYTISNMEAGSPVKQGASGVTTTAGWAGPLEVESQHWSSLRTIGNCYIEQNAPHQKSHLQRAIHYWIYDMRLQ